jgi:dolichol kinase
LSDHLVALIAVAVLGVGLGVCFLAHHLGLATTYVRDMLHIGTGVWVFGWPWFSSAAAPLVVVVTAALATLGVPLLVGRSGWARRVHDTFSSGDERWRGLSLYTLSYAIFTGVGFARTPFPAAAGLLALSLGDGVGGLVGRRFGKVGFRAPGGKRKTLEGSLAVALASMLGVALASWRFGEETALLKTAGLGMAAALAEALSPRGSDNLSVPTLVWVLAEVWS